VAFLSENLPALRLPRLPRAKQWLSSLVLATALALYVLAGISVTSLQPTGAARADVPTVNGRLVIPGLGTPPAPEPLRFREDVAPEDAVKINAAIPVSTAPNPPARPFRTAFATPADHTRAVECLAAAVYYEAGFEPVDGQRAVAQVVLNRVRHPAYPKSVCGVVFQGYERATGCQFTFTCDGAMARGPSAGNWTRARMVAEEALAGKVYAPVGWATHYHAAYVVPYWSSSLVKSAVVGQHIFYRWEGGWGRPPAFRFGATGTEPQIALMRSLTSDPSTLANAQDVVPVPTDAEAAAALAAAAANGDAPLAPGAKGAGTPGSIDSFQRSVLRRYEPPTPQQAANAAVAQTAQPSSTLHWALSGLPEKPQAPLGRKPAATAGEAGATPATAAPVKCLEGVRRAPAAAGAPPQKETC
jgi:spore germination cell wall hydrolase CwlJ-like protein